MIWVIAVMLYGEQSVLNGFNVLLCGYYVVARVLWVIAVTLLYGE